MIYLILLFLFAVLASVSGKNRVTGGILRRMSVFLYEHLQIGRTRNEKLSGNLARLYPQEKPEESRKQYEVERIKNLLTVLFVGDLVAMLLWVGEGAGEVLENGIYINRGKQGEGSMTVPLTVRGRDGEEADADMLVQECRYTDAELETLYENMLAEIDTAALGENDSWQKVTGNLNLMDSVEGYPFTLEWESNNYTAVTGSGQVADREVASEWAEEEVMVTLYMRAVYYDFEREHVFYARVCPLQEEQTFQERVQLSLKRAEEADPYSEKIELPEEIEGTPVVWSERRENRSGTIFLIGVTGAVLVWFMKTRELEQKVKKRSGLMEEEYAAIVSKFTLYLGAGLNVKSAWFKITEEGRGNPVYEEMCLTCREMEGGVGETEAYERFGKRIRLQRYIRLSTLLVQNLQKGNAALLVQLRQEVLLSREDRAAAVRKKGEEISTKLLFPMMLLLGMVMVWIMLPAFMSL